MNDEGLQNSAILLMSLGEEGAAQVLKHLSPREVQKLGHAMAGLGNIKRERMAEVLGVFQSDSEQRASATVGGDDYVRAVLTRALGDDRAAPLLGRILKGGEISGIEGLKWMGSPDVADLIRNEHPQIISTILVHLDRDQASEVLGCFDEALRGDVVLRIATLDGVQPAALQELNDVLTTLLAGSQTGAPTSLGGVRAAAELLNFLGGAGSNSIIETVRGHDADLAQKIVDEMFLFDDLLKLDDRSFQVILREVQSDALIVALKGTLPEMCDKVFKNMSQRAAEMLRDDLESKGPVKVSEVEAQQKEILKLVRRLADEGQIQLAGGGGDDGYV